MALNKQKMAINFVEGLDQKTDDKQAAAGTLGKLENAQLLKTGKISKKAGYAEFSRDIAGGGTLSNAKTIIPFKDEMSIEANDKLYTYSQDAADWVEKDDLVRVKTSAETLKSYYGNDRTTIAIGGGIRVVWHGTIGGNGYTVYDDSDGSLLTTVETDMVNIQGSAEFFNNEIVLTGDDGTHAYMYRIATTYPYGYTKLLFQSGLIASNDFSQVVLNNRLYVGYNDGTAIKYRYLDTGGTVSGATTVGTASGLAGGAKTRVCGDEASNDLWVITMSADATPDVYLEAAIYNSSDVAVQTWTLLHTNASTSRTDMFLVGAVVETSNVATIVYSKDISGSEYSTYKRTFNTSGTTGSETTVITGAIGAGGLTEYSSTGYFQCQTGGERIVVDTNGNMVSRLDDMIARPADQDLRGEVNGTTIEWVVANVNVAFVYKYTLDFNDKPRSYEYQGNTHIPGGLPLIYDGKEVVEENFLPASIGLSATTGGSLSSSGTYGVAVVYFYYDANGNEHKSAPEYASRTLSGDTRIDVSTRRPPTLKEFERVDRKIYATEDGGSLYYLQTTLLGSSSTALFQTYNMTSISTTTPAYFNSGELADNPPGSYSHITAHNNRLILTGIEQGSNYRVSKPRETAVGSVFPLELEYDLESVGGNLVASASIIEKLILFKPRSIYYTVGEFADNLGLNDTTIEPERISENIGCVNAKSVVETQIGVFFESDKGIYKLNPDLSLEYVGAAAEDDFAGGNITAAINVPDKHEVRFSTSGGDCMVYNYLYGKWSKTLSYAAVDAGVYEGKFVYLKSDGTLCQEDSSFTDGATGVSLKMATNWISLAGFQNVQRVYKVLVSGEYKAAHTLNMRVYYDWDETAYDDYSITALNDERYQYRFDLTKQKCQAIKFEIWDSSSSAEGLEISAIALEVGAKRGAGKLQTNRITSET